MTVLKKKMGLLIFSVLGLVLLSLPSKGQPKLAGEERKEIIVKNLDFDNTDIHIVLRALYEQTGFQYIEHEGVRGNVTIHVEEATLEETLKLILEPSGLSYVKKGRVYHIGKKVDEQIAKRITETCIVLNRKASDLKEVVKGMLSPEGDITVDAATNSLIITDYPSVVNAIKEKVRELDVSIEEIAEIKPLTQVFTLKNAKAADVKRYLEEAKLLSPKGTIVAVERTNTLIVKDTPEIIEVIRELIETHLDIPTPEVVTYVFQIKNMEAESLKAPLASVIPKDAKIDINKEANSLIISGRPAKLDLDKIREVIEELDVKPEEKVTHVIPLKHVKAETVVDTLKGMISKRGSITVNKEANSVIITDIPSALDMEKINRVIEELDVEIPETRTFTLEQAEVEKLKDTISKMISDKGKIIADIRTNSFIITDYPSNLDRLAELLAEIDIEASEKYRRGLVMKIFKLNYASVEQLRETLKPLLPERKLRREAPRDKEQDQEEDLLARESAREKSKFVIFDSRTNTIVISDTRENLELIGQIIEELDTMTQQVLIKAKIMEITWSGDLQKGLRVGIMDKDSSAQAIMFLLPALGGPGLSLSAGMLSIDEFEAGLQALGSETKVNILSEPKIITLDNQPAKIKVGQDVPINLAAGSSQFSVTEGAPSPFQMVETGVILRVTPHINKDNMITMRIEEEVSMHSGDTAQNMPIISTRRAETTVICKTGKTVALGGLLQDTNTTSIAKIPILGDIPLLKHFFRRTHVRKGKNDLIVFITPYILDQIPPKSTEDSTTEGIDVLTAKPVEKEGGIILDWSEDVPMDNIEIGHYNIYRDRVPISRLKKENLLTNKVKGEATSYADLTGKEGETYYYAVTAVDISDNEQVISNIARVEVNDITPPLSQSDSTGIDRLKAYPQEGTANIILDWSERVPKDNVGIDHYNIYREKEPIINLKDKKPLATAIPEATSYIDTTGKEGEVYYYTVTAVDTSANEQVVSNSPRAKVNDITPPESNTDPATKGIDRLTAELIEGTREVILDWSGDPPSDNVALDHFNIYRDEKVIVSLKGKKPLDEVGPEATSYIDKGRKREKTYYYAVTAVDTSGNEQEISNSPQVTIKSNKLKKKNREEPENPIEEELGKIEDELFREDDNLKK